MRLWIALAFLFVCAVAEARDFARRFPTDTAMEVYTPGSPPDGTIYGFQRVGTSVILTTSTDNVGIGTSTPRAKLDVEGSVYMKGNVGIGTSAPIAPLDVQSHEATNDDFNVWNNTDRGWADITYGANVDSSKYAYAETGYAIGNPTAGVDKWLWYMGAEGTLSDAGTLSSTDFYFYNGQTDKYNIYIEGDDDVGIGGVVGYPPTLVGMPLVVKATGNVGIGTISPAQKLQVDGSVYVSTGNVGIGTAVSRAKLDVEGAVYMKGNVGIGTFDPSYLLQINSNESWENVLWIQGDRASSDEGMGITFALNAPYYASNEIWYDFLFNGVEKAGFSAYADGRFAFTTLNNDRMTIDSTGNVGIGTSIPRAKLDVEGSVYMKGNVGIGMVPATGAKLDVAYAVNAIALANDAAIGWKDSGGTVRRNYLLTGANVSYIGPVDVGWGSGTNLSAGTSISLRVNGATGTFTTAATINATGNVGIGTATPAQLLDVQGGAQFGSGNVNLIASTGKIPGLTSTYFTSVDASTLTGLNASNLSSGTVPAARMSSTTNFYSIDPQFPLNAGHFTLGSASIGEIALSKVYTQNKLQFVNPISIEYTVDGAVYDTYGVAVDAQAVKNMALGYYKAGAGITIYGPNNGNYVALRMTFQAPSYSFLNAFYSYNSTSGHTMKVLIERSYGDDINTWSTVALTASGSSWPGHLLIPHSSIPWNPTSTPGTHSKYVRVTFIPTWNATYPNNNIALYSNDWWGQYPANTNPAELFTWDSDKNVNFNQGNVGIGSASPATKLNVVSTTEQLRVGYDGSKYMSATVASNGAVTLDSVGTSPSLTLSDNTTVSGTLIVNGNSASVSGTNPSIILADTDGGGGRPNIYFTGNDLFYFAGDDTGSGTTLFNYYSKFSDARANNAVFRVFGSASSSFGNYIQFKHTGDSGYGEIATDVGSLVLSPAANVGIGTTAPSNKLDVKNGSISTDTAIYVGTCWFNPATGGTNWVCP